MPYFDERAGTIVARIVYDGAPEAGKTTNIARICDQVGEGRRGVLWSPGSESRQTEYFDWLEFSGGFFAGHRVLCQIVSVPGQKEKQHRRRILLETADVIVLVADSSERKLEETLDALAFALEVQATRSGVGLLVQANKQDAVDALRPEHLRDLLGLDATSPVLGAVASTGEGVMYTFVMAARIAIDQARQVTAHGELAPLPSGMRDGETLLRRLLALEPQHDAEQARSAPAAHPAEGWEGVVENHYVVRHELPQLPDAALLATGHVWPPAEGRAYLSAAGLGQRRVFSSRVGDCEVLTVSNTDGWSLQAFPFDLFETESAAQFELLEVVRGCLRNPAWVDSRRALAIYPDGERWRLWCLVRTRPSLEEMLLGAAGQAALGDVLELVRRADALRAAHPPTGCFRASVSLASLAPADDSVVLQAMRYSPVTASAHESLFAEAMALLGGC